MDSTHTLLAGSFAGAAALAFSIPLLGAPAIAAPAPAPTCAALPDSATFIAAGPAGATIERTSGSESLPLPITSTLEKVVRGPDGTIWAQASGERGDEIHRIAPDGSTSVVGIGEFRLQNAGWLQGRSAAVVIDDSSVAPPGEPDFNGAVLVHYPDGTSTDVGPAGGPEFGVGSTMIGAGRLTQGAGVDLTESFAYFDAAGGELTDWFDPTDRATYNAPPLFQFPIAGSSGGEGADVLTWVEGPDWDGATNHVVGGWSLVAADPRSGTESLRVDLGEAGEHLIHADFDGRVWVGTFDTPDAESAEPSTTPGRVFVVDFRLPDPVAADAVCPAGVTLTLDKSGTPEPAPTPPAPTTVAPPPTTAVPPTTAAPGRCADYVAADHGYPIRRCEQGVPVHGVQLMLVHRGYEIAVDGYFGPATEQAVRQFQADAGVEVDGLVGPDTWAALYDPGYLPGVDNDGNGTVDPWELVLDPGNPGETPADRGDYVGLVWTEEPPEFLIVDESTGAPVAGLSSRGGTIVHCCDVPMFLVSHVVGSDRNMMWLSRSEGHNPDGTPLPWTVLAVVDFPLAQGAELSTLCDLDGASIDAVRGVVGVPHSGGGGPYPVTAAWIVDTAAGAFTPVDVARVTCSFEGD